MASILDILLLFQSVRGCISILALTYRLQQLHTVLKSSLSLQIQRNFLSIDMQLKENFQSLLGYAKKVLPGSIDRECQQKRLLYVGL
mgnify:CR=1 FL=1